MVEACIRLQERERESRYKAEIIVKGRWGRGNCEKIMMQKKLWNLNKLGMQ